MAECTYKDGYQNGIHKSYYPNGKLKQAIPLKNGYVNGMMKFYDDKGVLVHDATVKDNYYHGVQHYYHTNGKVFTTRIYSLGMLLEIKEVKDRNGKSLDPGDYENGNGTMKLYNEFGAHIMSAEYKRGIRNGKTTHYWPNGNLRTEYKMVDDTIHGIEKSYDEQGRLQFESKVVKGLYQGSKKFYYPDGKLWGEWSMKDNMIWNSLSLVDTTGKPIDFGNFKDGNGTLINFTDSCIKEFSVEYKEGIPHGKSIQYYRNGKIFSEADFVEGTVDGIASYYDENGILVKSYEMKEGLIDGSYKEFHANGKLYFEIYYVRGYVWNVVSMSDTSGRPLDFGTLKNGNGYLKMYDEGGFFTEKYEYVDGLLNGKAEKYYKSGKLKLEYTYVNDTIDGVRKMYTEDGALHETRPFRKGKMHGTTVIYHSNGKPWTSRTYVDGLLWSVEFNYDMNGKPRDVGTLKNGNGTMLRYDENEKVIFIYEVSWGKIQNQMGDVEETW